MLEIIQSRHGLFHLTGRYVSLRYKRILRTLWPITALFQLFMQYNITFTVIANNGLFRKLRHTPYTRVGNPKMFGPFLLWELPKHI